MKNRTKKILIVILSILIVISGAYLAINLYADSLLNKMNRGEVIKKEDANINEDIVKVKEAHKVFNFVLFGVDSSTGNDQGESERSDAMKIISLDYTDKKIMITSVERDVVAYFPGDYQGYGHYNWAYWYGGPTLAIQTLNYNLDLDITNYVSISFAGLESIVDAVGGVDIYLSNGEANLMGLSPGSNHLNGDLALIYARIRELDSDYVRMERQNAVIQAIVSKFSSLGFTDMLDVVVSLLPYVSTNFTNDQIKTYLYDIIGFDLSNIETYKLPSGGYDDTLNCSGLGGYLLRSYSDQVIELHKNIYSIDDYKPSKTVMDNEKNTYDKYGYPDK